MISVDEALSRLFSLVRATEHEQVPLQDAAGRVLAESVIAQRDQPPFAASAMDGYAVRNADVKPGARLRVVGESAAGHLWPGTLNIGECIRISTGAPVPASADRIVIQEDVTRKGSEITLGDALDPSPYIRPAGTDFRKGLKLQAPKMLSMGNIAVLAAMNVSAVTVHKRPDIALISTGDELVMPGENPRNDQITASNTFGLKVLLEANGAKCRILPIARDNAASLRTSFELAHGADLVITIGGASVGDHDIVHSVASELGLEQQFYKVAMRPGKPLMAGRLGTAAMVGLPGNPVSALVCGHVFLVPLLRAMQGLPETSMEKETALLAHSLPENGPREHYMRALVAEGGISVFDRQDSSLLTVLADANALICRPPYDAPKTTGEKVNYIKI